MVMGGGSSNLDGPNALRLNRPLNAYKYEQECIPVGCVPSAAVAISGCGGVWPGGVCQGGVSAHEGVCGGGVFTTHTPL